jgi:FMN phosphatase YigB (HAD superfamily)
MRTIFFDFGNVIAFFDHQRAVAKLAAHTKLPPTELTLALYGGVVEADYECGRVSTAEYIRLATRDGQLTCTPGEFEAAFVDIFTRNPDVCDLIPRLRPKYRLVLASNTNDAHYRKYTEQFADVLAHFDARCPSHHARSRKPHPEYFAFCQRHTPHPPAECVLVDDLPSNIEAAGRHGWQGVLYQPGVDLIGLLKAAGIQLGEPAA